MRWSNRRRSSNIDDRRGQRHAAGGMGANAGAAALLRFVPLLMRTKLGKVVLLLGALYFGYQYLTGGALPLDTAPSTANSQPSATASGPMPTTTDDQASQFVAAVLASTEDLWRQQLPEHYVEPTLVLYNGITATGCGTGMAQTGPFYCPADQQIYIDLSFMTQLEQLGAPGDFAFAYVIAHEVGHHIQTRLGISQQVQRLRQQANKTESNRLSTRLELQADCFAGIWGRYAEQQGMLEAGDLQEGLQAAAAVGDDNLQRRAGQAVQSENFSHGSSAQRTQWFQKGYDSGQLSQCDTMGLAN